MEVDEVLGLIAQVHVKIAFVYFISLLLCALSLASVHVEVIRCEMLMKWWPSSVTLRLRCHKTVEQRSSCSHFGPRGVVIWTLVLEIGRRLRLIY
jgi:NhaP-type Na+/H+ or K+/H+ antiporter